MRPLFYTLSLLCSLSICWSTPPNTEGKRPDIICILVDDMGYSDLGCYGGEIETPNLDRLASEGLRFTQFYNASKCEPTRASLMSGRYWPETGLGLKHGHTIGEVLQEADYTTFAIGKWHLDGHPMDRGFDHYFGHLSGASAFFPPLNPSFYLDRDKFSTNDAEFYTTDAFTDYAIEFIKNSKEEDPDKPFFLYLAYNAPHNPLQAPDEDIAKYRGKYLRGWDEIRKSRYERLLQLGIIKPGTKLSPQPNNIPDWDSLSPEQQDLEDLRMAVYAAMIDRLDQNIGRLMDYLKNAHLDNDLLVVFLSDNGGSPFSRTDANMLARNLLPGDARSNWEIGTAWANVSNTPFRLYKRNQHEGGIATPCIVWWSDNIESPGDITEQTAHIIDLLPTFMEVANIEEAELSEMDKNLAPLPGYSLLPILAGEERQPHEFIYFQLFDHRAIRSENWKLVAVDGKPWELYNLTEDRSETNDLSHENSAIAYSLDREWNRWWKQTTKRSYNSKRSVTATKDMRDDREGGAEYVPTTMPDRLKNKR
ncbi:arylsulfatase [Rubellicoccus peritrichatus]|uniref:Arylsulfatase n=1 Tax=Rubellicoccus peritrichatus TaxID=3080537 RepID=A0AAQ3QX47_9BACT|nr:arylsulfatase [Puniceicoccus sp. CR14]WOO43308.1 arylsulfatase [Puniceicoccus sp. CR14]